MGHKNVPNIVSLSHCLEQLFPCILTVINVKAKKRRMRQCFREGQEDVIFFCLLPVGVCIGAYVAIRSYVLCVSTH